MVAMSLAPATQPLFSSVGTAAGKELTRWCKSMPGGSLHRRLMHERSDDNPNRIVLDVGSFDGSDAVNFARATQRRVFTFEPTPSKLEPIRERLLAAGLADNVTLFPFALSNTTGEKKLKMYRAPRPAGRAFVHNQLGSAQDTLVEDDASGSTAAAPGVVAVPVRQLDAVLAEHMPHARVAFLKVDAQGFDMLVLRGAARLLAERRIERFLFEFTPYGMPGTFEAAVAELEWLERAGHSCVPCNQGHTIAVKVMAPTPVADFVNNFRMRNMSYDDIICQPISRERPA